MITRYSTRGEEPVLIPHVRREGRHLGVALAHQLGIHHEIPDIDVGEQALVPVPELDVEFEADGLSRDQPAIHGVRFGAEGRHPLLRVLSLRGADAEVAHPDLAAVKGHWQLTFAGVELKVSERKGRTNRFTGNLSTYAPDLLPHLEEFLRDYRPRFLNGATSPFVFVTCRVQSFHHPARRWMTQHIATLPMAYGGARRRNVEG
jgi:hypothetical protein